ncbi:hypothetical protein D3C71_2209080 [compost metagenome]
MAAQKVEARFIRLLRVPSQQSAHRIGKLPRIVMTEHEEIKHRIRKRIIHNAIKLVALQPHQ